MKIYYSKTTLVLVLSGILGLLLGLLIAYGVDSYQDYRYKSLNNICTNNDTRDYEYEAYCDSLWKYNRKYYLDTLMETEKYQFYVESHGSWWDNSN